MPSRAQLRMGDIAPIPHLDVTYVTVPSQVSGYLVRFIVNNRDSL
jgi:hypothetical protein